MKLKVLLLILLFNCKFTFGAIRINASGDYLLRTSGLPAFNAFTICGWAKHRSDQSGNYAMLASIESGTSSAANTIVMGWFPDATNQIAGYTGGGVTPAIGNPAVDAWFFFAMTIAGAGANELKFYFGDLAGTALNVHTTTASASFTPGAIFVGNDSYAEWSDTSFRNIKIYDAVLSAAELELERWSSDPQRTSNLHLWTPLIGDTLDDSGNSKDWTEGGTIGIESGQPILRPYTTNFPDTEDPISQDGIWINGDAVGLDWEDVVTTTNKAYGCCLRIGYDDPTAIFKGAWASDHEISATVVSLNGATGTTRELELRLRTTITANVNSGYECLINSQVGGYYAQIVRWNGTVGDFTPLSGSTGPAYMVTPVTGDVLKGTAVGNTISCYLNDSLIMTADDMTFTGGSPGIGFFGDTGTTMTDFGYSVVTANDGKTTFTPGGGGGGTGGCRLSLLGAGGAC